MKDACPGLRSLSTVPFGKDFRGLKGSVEGATVVYAEQHGTPK